MSAIASRRSQHSEGGSDRMPRVRVRMPTGVDAPEQIELDRARWSVRLWYVLWSVIPYRRWPPAATVVTLGSRRTTALVARDGHRIVALVTLDGHRIILENQSIKDVTRARPYLAQ